jgi:hypothetical protein
MQQETCSKKHAARNIAQEPSTDNHSGIAMQLDPCRMKHAEE